jgi:hypothetical protein
MPPGIVMSVNKMAIEWSARMIDNASRPFRAETT